MKPISAEIRTTNLCLDPIKLDFTYLNQSFDLFEFNISRDFFNYYGEVDKKYAFTRMHIAYQEQINTPYCYFSKKIFAITEKGNIPQNLIFDFMKRPLTIIPIKGHLIMTILL